MGVSLLVFVAISLSLARVSLPYIDDYKSDVEIWISSLIGQQVEIATLDAAWYGMEPQLVLKGVQLLSDDRMDTLGYFQQARLGLDLFSSAIDGRFRPGAFTLEGARFVLIRHRNGEISLEGFDSPKSSNTSDNNRLLKEWFFGQRLLDVKSSEIVWIDLTRDNQPKIFNDVNLRFRNDGKRHWVDGLVDLPDSLGEHLKISLDVRGDLLSADSWVGNIYLEGEKLNIVEVTKNFSLDNFDVSGGAVSLRLWSKWKKAKIHSLQGSVIFSDVQLSARDAPRMRVIRHLSTNFSAIKNPSDWEATFDKVIVRSGRKLWPETRLDIKYNPVSGSLASEIAYLDLGEVLPIAGFFGRKDQVLSQTISGIKALGIVSRLNILLDSSGESPRFLLKGMVSNFHSRAWRKFPGISGLDGQFKVSNRALSAQFPRQNFVLDYRDKFHFRHEVESFKASLFTVFNENEFQLSAKDVEFKFKEVNSSGSLNYQKLENDESQLDLAFYFNGGLVSDVKYYLPSKIMPETTVDWLDTSLLGGKIDKGGLIYYGALRKFPFKENDGVFDVNLDIKNGQLKFSKDWPEISSINGELDLTASKMSFTGRSGEASNADLKNVKVSIPDYRLKDKMLLITGQAYGETSDKLSYLFASPMGRNIAKSMEPLKLIGKSDLDLDITIPLLTPEKVTLFGELLLKDNHLLADDWKLDVENVSTNLRFNNDGVWSDDLQAEMKKIKLRGKVETVRKDDKVNLVIHNSAHVTHNEVTRLLKYFVEKSHWGKYFKGDAEINTDVVIPLGSIESPLELTLKTDMKGMSIDMPYPLRKKAEKKENFRLNAELTGKKRLLKIDYGDTHSVFEILATKDSQQIQRGGIGFSKYVDLPDEIGYRFSGQLAEFLWTEWEPLLFPEENEKALLESGGSSGSIYFDVDVDRFSLFGYKFGPTAIQASSTSQLWTMHVSGKELEGQIIIPVVLSSSPMIVDMDRLHVISGKSENESLVLDPREMPEINIKVADFKYNDIPFGLLDVDAKKISEGLHLDKFNMKNQSTSISAQGDWLISSGKQLSKFNVLVKSTDFGEAISEWGFANAIAGGKGDINLNVEWSGNPSDFDFKSANGDVEIKTKDTSMLGFELGAAKMFGLLLPRRLILDFRDVFKKGILFDEINGKYQIQSGDAFTSGLYLKGPVIDIHMAGRIGLGKKDYDQVVTVNRRILGDSLPVLAALTAATPIIAAQVFIFKKMFAKQIDDILSVQYTIEGSWDDPLITPVIKNPSTGEDLTDDILNEFVLTINYPCARTN